MASDARQPEDDLGDFENELAALESDEEHAPNDEPQQSEEGQSEKSPSPGQVQQSIEQPQELPSPTKSTKVENVSKSPSNQLKQEPQHESPKPAK